MQDVLRIVLQIDTFCVEVVKVITNYPLLHVVFWLLHVFNVLQADPGSDFAVDELHTTVQMVVDCEVIRTQLSWVQKPIWRGVQNDVRDGESGLSSRLHGAVQILKSLLPTLLKVAELVQTAKVWWTPRINIVGGSHVTLKLHYLASISCVVSVTLQFDHIQYQSNK